MEELKANSKSDECTELKNLQYKNRLLFGKVQTNTRIKNDMAGLEDHLESEKIQNLTKSWNKLDRTTQTQKLAVFAQEYKELHNLDDIQLDKLIEFFQQCLDRKRLNRVKDINYNIKTGEILNIPTLHFMRSENHFTLKNSDKRVVTQKGLGSSRIRKVGTLKTKSPDESDEIET